MSGLSAVGSSYENVSNALSFIFEDSRKRALITAIATVAMSTVVSLFITPLPFVFAAKTIATSIIFAVGQTAIINILFAAIITAAKKIHAKKTTDFRIREIYKNCLIENSKFFKPARTIFVSFTSVFFTTCITFGLPLTSLFYSESLFCSLSIAILALPIILIKDIYNIDALKIERINLMKQLREIITTISRNLSPVILKENCKKMFLLFARCEQLGIDTNEIQTYKRNLLQIDQNNLHLGFKEAVFVQKIIQKLKNSIPEDGQNAFIQKVLEVDGSAFTTITQQTVLEIIISRNFSLAFIRDQNEIATLANSYRDLPTEDLRREVREKIDQAIPPESPVAKAVWTGIRNYASAHLLQGNHDYFNAFAFGTDLQWWKLDGGIFNIPQ